MAVAPDEDPRVAEPDPMASADAQAEVALDGPYDVGLALESTATAHDPTHRSRPGSVAFSGHTPEGPVAVRVRATVDAARVEAWGPGSAWMVDRAEAVVGVGDDPRHIRFDDDRLDELNRRHPGLRHGATGCVVDSLLARTIGQRVLAVEAGRSWAAMCRELGGQAPGPVGLLLPPAHDRVARTPSWWFHQHGIDRGRASTMIAVARSARRLGEIPALPLPQAYGQMRGIPGVGPWTANGAARTALGDPDAITVGDFWISHTVCSYFTGRARGSDDEMLRLVDRWAGQRGRVERLIHLSGHRVERFGPGRPTPDIRRL